MSDDRTCMISGCRKLKTVCQNCGRIVSTAELPAPTKTYSEIGSATGIRFPTSDGGEFRIKAGEVIPMPTEMEMRAHKIEVWEDEWVDCRERLPLPGQLVKMRHTILSEAAWNGKEFLLTTAQATCDPSKIEKYPNHDLRWRLVTDEEKNNEIH